jgi:excisionase family DNA binding protein
MKIYTNVNSPVKRAVKVSEAAGMLGVSESSVRRLISRGILKPIRVLRHLLIPLKQLDALLNGDGPNGK